MYNMYKIYAEEVIPALGAGLVSTFICNPLDVIRINYQLKK